MADAVAVLAVPTSSVDRDDERPALGEGASGGLTLAVVVVVVLAAAVEFELGECRGDLLAWSESVCTSAGSDEART